MKAPASALYREDQLRERDMQRIARIVHGATGIVLDDTRRALVTGRLAKRLRALSLSSYREYADLLSSDRGADEMQGLIDAITTNKTSFFREPHHFTFLRERLEERMRAAESQPELRRLDVWSAGCSSGEEPYSVAMTIAETLGPALGAWHVRVLATDIDSQVLAFAREAIYPRARTEGAPATHFERVPGDAGVLRVKPRIAGLVTFRRLNFMDAVWPISGAFDHVFCRNVTIYFDRPTQATLYPRLASHVAQGGFFYAGHSENLAWLPELFRPAGLTVYARAGEAPAPAAGRASVSGTFALGAAAPAREAALPERSIVAGEVYATEAPTVLRTTLGSCVSVCMFDPVAKVGGMNHFALPSSSEGEASDRFGIHAMETLINRLLKLGGARHRLVAKIAGAAHVVDVGARDQRISTRNLTFVEAFLADEGFSVAGRRVGGTKALEVRFRTDTGEARVREVDAAPRVLEEERRGRPATPPTDDVEWFR